jgi:hypothetical protein
MDFIERPVFRRLLLLTIFAAVLLALPVVLGLADYRMACSGHNPTFSICRERFFDGGSAVYTGLGYRVSVIRGTSLLARDERLDPRLPQRDVGTAQLESAAKLTFFPPYRRWSTSHGILLEGNVQATGNPPAASE